MKEKIIKVLKEATYYVGGVTGTSFRGFDVDIDDLEDIADEIIEAINVHEKENYSILGDK